MKIICVCKITSFSVNIIIIMSIYQVLQLTRTIHTCHMPSSLKVKHQLNMIEGGGGRVLHLLIC